MMKFAIAALALAFSTASLATATAEKNATNTEKSTKVTSQKKSGSLISSANAKDMVSLEKTRVETPNTTLAGYDATREGYVLEQTCCTSLNTER